MLSASIESRHLDRFRQALYYLESFHIQGKKWVIDIYNLVRVVNQNNILDTETSWGKLGYIEDWFTERVELRKGSWNPSLSTLKRPYKRRYKTFTKLYSIGHRRGERTRARPGGPYLANRRKITSVIPWTRYLISYLEQRRVSRSLEAENDFGYEPTLLDVEKLLLAAARSYCANIC